MSDCGVREDYKHKAVLNQPPAPVFTVAATIDFAGTAVNTGTGITQTFAAAPTGTPTNGRYLVICVSARMSTDTLNTVTVDGASCTIVAKIRNAASPESSVVITDAPVTTGSTASIACTFSSTVINCGIAVYALNGIISTTPTATATTVTDNSAQSLSILAGGVAVGVGCYGAGNATWTLTGLTEDFDQAISSGSSSFAGGSTTSAIDQNLSITFDCTTATPTATAMASFR